MRHARLLPSNEIHSVLIAAGFLAFEDGLTLDQNPHAPDDAGHDVWRMGWTLGKAENEG